MKSVFILLSILMSLTFLSCERNKDGCFNEALVHSNACTTDCPGVCGCDGQIYCNECEANRNGIEVKYNGPCQN